jgi:hypothetical protein
LVGVANSITLKYKECNKKILAKLSIGTLNLESKYGNGKKNDAQIW